MLAPDVRFEGFTADEWLTLLALFREELRSLRHEPGQASGGVIALTQGRRIYKLVHTERGALPIDDAVWHSDLRRLAKEHGARFAVALHGGVLSDLTQRVASKVKADDHLLRQLLLFLTTVRELESEGACEFWPTRLADLPIPSEAMAKRGLDALAPVGKVAAIGIFHDGTLETCLCARRSETGFDWIMGPDRLRRDMGLLSGDFRRDYRYLVAAIENRLGPLAVGCFGERAALRSLIHSPFPGAWASAVAARDIIVSPIAPAIALPLGLDVGRAAITFVRALATGIERSHWLGLRSELAPRLEKATSYASSHWDLEGLFGFDPLSLLKALLSKSGSKASVSQSSKSSPPP